ncbi:MAG TPA: hypothetical protein VIC84_04875 [Blastocatellia bacterium]|jgi:hypothetical protein
MQDKLYAVIGNKTAADVVARNDEVIARGLELEEARRVAIAAQKSAEWIAAWVEADSPSRIFGKGDEQQ